MRQAYTSLGGAAALPSQSSIATHFGRLATGLIIGLGLGTGLPEAQCPGEPTPPSTLTRETFENEDPACWSSSNSGCGQFRGITDGLSIATSPARGTKSLKVSHLANETYRHAEVTIRPTDTLIYRAYYYFPSGYDFGQGQKIARFLARGDETTIHQNLYLQLVSASGDQCNMTNSGSLGLWSTTGPAFTAFWGSVNFVRGQWYAVKVQLIYNTPGVSNGSAAIWVNGQVVAQSTGINLRGTLPASVKWTDVQVGGGYSNGGNGNTTCANPNPHAEYYVDDVEIGTNNDVINPGPGDKVLSFYSTLETENATCWNAGGTRQACGAFTYIRPDMTLETNSSFVRGGSKALKIWHTVLEGEGRANVNVSSTDTLWYSAWYKFHADFDYGMGMKIARFTTYNGTAQANDIVLQIRSAGTAAEQCGETGAGDLGVFHNCSPSSTCQGTGFSPVTTSLSGVNLATWNNFKVRLIYNKVGQTNGGVTLYLNGNQVAQYTGATRGTIPANVKFSQITAGGWYSNNHNGQVPLNCRNPSNSTTFYHIDDIKVANVDPE